MDFTKTKLKKGRAEIKASDEKHSIRIQGRRPDFSWTRTDSNISDNDMPRLDNAADSPGVESVIIPEKNWFGKCKCGKMSITDSVPRTGATKTIIFIHRV